MIFLSAIKKSLLLALFIVASLGLQAQLLEAEDYNDPNATGGNNNSTESGSNPPPPDTGDPGAPIDGGLGFLLAAGVGYGANKLRKYRKEKRTFDQ